MTALSMLALTAAFAPLLPLCLGLYNRWTWPRPAPTDSHESEMGSVSVLIPTRNEARNIRACLESVLQQGAAVREVLVYSDESTDETESIVRSIAATDPRVRLIVGGRLPAGWVGKPHACQELGRSACATWLLFMDADVRLAPRGLSGLLQALRPLGLESSLGNAVISALPKQQSRGWLLGVLQPLLLLTYVSWLPLAWANRQQSPRFLAACGQLLLLSPGTFETLGGFRDVRHAVVDDLEFCRHARKKGARVVFLDAHELAVCRMYETLRDFWRGFAKNLFLGLGSELNLALALGLHAVCFLLPYGLFGAWLFGAWQGAPLSPEVLVASCAGILLNTLHRLVLARHHGHRASAVLLHPLAVLVLVVLSLDSWRRARFVGVEWSGRNYEGRPA